MARRSRMSIVKRQRELKKAEKAAKKRARRHGVSQEGFTEPVPTRLTALGLDTNEPGAGPAAVAQRGESDESD